MDRPTKFVFLVMASLPPLLSLFFYFVVTRVEIGIDPTQMRWFVVGLILFMTVRMFKSLFVLLTLPERGIYFAGYVLFVTVCVGIPIGFAAIYSAFQRTGDCISNFDVAYDAVHFSYTTFTTLGYGDLSPVGLCRLFTAAESVLGYVSLGLGIAILLVIFQDKSRATENERYEALEKKVMEMVEDSRENSDSNLDSEAR